MDKRHDWAEVMKNAAIVLHELEKDRYLDKGYWKNTYRNAVKSIYKKWPLK